MSENGVKQLPDLPPSAKLVFKTLEYANRELTQQDIVVRSRLSARTTRYALDQLKSSEIVGDRINIADAIRYILTRPNHVGINELVVHPRDQDTP